MNSPPKLRITYEPLAHRDSRYVAINDNEYDGAPDAGPQMVGTGPTEDAARVDFWEQWLEREAERDMKRAVEQAKVWDGVFAKLFPGLQS